MANGYDNNNTGVLFNNTDGKRPDHPNDPDYRGSVEVAGNEYWLAGWIKTPKGPTEKNPKQIKFLSLAFQPKDPQAPAIPNANVAIEDDDEKMPF